MQRWIGRAGVERIDRVDFAGKPRGGARRQTSVDIEDLIVELRRQLRDEDDLGDCGAEAIHARLKADGHTSIPAVRTIGRILERRGLLDRKRRRRYLPPPPGWYLPDVADGVCELDSFDIIEGLHIKNGPEIEVLTSISLHGPLLEAWPRIESIRSKDVIELLCEYWRREGLPAYVQFDNDTVFQGPHNRPDVIGSVVRFCLSLGVIPVFAPPRDPSFQARVESLNGRWQQRVWSRFQHGSVEELCERSARYIAAARLRAQSRSENAPTRKPFPENFRLDLQRELRGQIVFIRRTRDNGHVRILENEFVVDPKWTNRLVRATLDLDDHLITFHALRRREPGQQRLLATLPHKIARKPFIE